MGNFCELFGHTIDLWKKYILSNTYFELLDGLSYGNYFDFLKFFSF